MRVLSSSLGGLALIAAAGSAAALLGACSDRPPPPAGMAALPVRVETVRLEPAVETARYAAVIRPRVEAELGFRVGGKVIRRLVETGSRVEAGTALAELDAGDLELQLRAAEAQLAAARADAANARADFQRYAQLRQGEWTTRQEFDRRRTTLDTAEARVRELDAQARVARNNTRYAVLTADGPGVVTAVLAEPGQVLAAGQAVFRVARLGELEAVANLPEQQVAALDGSDLTVTLWAMPGVAMTGRLRELSPIADAASRTYQARITLVEPPPTVQFGMTATLTLRPPASGLVARLPMTALTKRDTAPAVLVVNAAGDTVELRPVTVERYAGDRVLVASGVAEGERVVTAGVHKLDPGQRVRVWTEPGR